MCVCARAVLYKAHEELDVAKQVVLNNNTPKVGLKSSLLITRLFVHCPAILCVVTSDHNFLMAYL